MFSEILDGWIYPVFRGLFLFSQILFSIGIISVLLFALRSIWILLSRSNGNFNPEHYARWPRFPWRFLAGPIIKFYQVLQESWLGGKQKTRWASFPERLLQMYKPGQLFVGRLVAMPEIPMIKNPVVIPLLMPVGISTNLHVLIVAGAGAGKSSTLISMLALHPGNAFVIDPAGELSATLLKRCGKGGAGIRGKGHKALVLDPRGRVSGCSSASWNVFDEIARIQSSRGVEAVPAYVKKLVRALIPGSERDNNEALTDTARNFVVGLVLHVYTTAKAVDKNLVYVGQLLHRSGWAGSQPGEKVDESGVFPSYRRSLDCLLVEMENNPSFGGAVSLAISDVKDLFREGRHGDRLVAARTQLDWLSDPQMQAISVHSDFSVQDIRTGELTVFVCAPVTEIHGSLCGWFRLLTTIAMEQFEHEPRMVSKYTTLFVIDEMPSLGYVDAIDKSGPLMRKSGLQLIGVTQDLQRLRSAYPRSDEGFISNMGLTLWMAPAPKDATYLEGLLGTRTHGADSGPGGDRPLASAAQLSLILAAKEGTSRSNILVRPRSGPPMILRTPHYFKELPVYYYESPVDKTESAGRAATRTSLSDASAKTTAEIRGRVAGKAAKLTINSFGRSKLLKLNEDYDLEESFYDAHFRQVTAGCMSSDGRYLVLGEVLHKGNSRISMYDPFTREDLGSIELDSSEKITMLSAGKDPEFVFAGLSPGRVLRIEIKKLLARDIVEPIAFSPLIWLQSSPPWVRAINKLFYTIHETFDGSVRSFVKMDCQSFYIHEDKSDATLVLKWDNRPMGLLNFDINSGKMAGDPWIFANLGRDDINDAAVLFLEKERILLVGDTHGVLKAFSIASRSIIWDVKLDSAILALDVSNHDSQSKLAVLTKDGVIHFYNSRTGASNNFVLNRRHEVQEERVCGVKYFAGGARILTLDRYWPCLTVWDVQSGQKLGSVDVDFAGFDLAIQNDWHPSATVIVMPASKGMVVAVKDEEGFKAAKFIDLSRFWPT